MNITGMPRPGQANLTGNVDALFLKKFSGEVLAEFEVNQVAMNFHTVRTIENGKGANFAKIGRATAKYHVAGQDILEAANGYLSAIGNNEIYVPIDAPLLASTFVPSIDELMNHWDVRSRYASELGKALAYAFDKNILRTGILAARKNTADVTGGPVGTVIAAGATITSDVNVLVDSIIAGLVKLDEKNVSRSDMAVILRPADYWRLLTHDKVANSDFGGSGFTTGKVPTIGGASIVMSNHLPSTDEGGTQDTGVNNTYKANYANTMALLVGKEAVGTVKLFDIQSEFDYSTQHQGYLMLSKYAMGHGIIRQECAVEITKA
jgi:hypothetical protein